MHFILTSAAKHNVDELSLVQEIQQLGLPQQNSIVIGTEYNDAKDALKARLREDSYRLSRVISTAWRVDLVGSVDEEVIQAQPEIAINLRIRIDSQPQIGSRLTTTTNIESAASSGGDQNRIQDLLLNISVEKLDLLIIELTEARSIMKTSQK